MWCWCDMYVLLFTTLMCMSQSFSPVTNQSKHTYCICKCLPLALNYDTVVIVFGDGLIHEAYNGFAEHEQLWKAFGIPIMPIPTGSGNGTSLNLLGINECPIYHVYYTSLTELSGQVWHGNCCTQHHKRYDMYLSTLTSCAKSIFKYILSVSLQISG